MPTIRPNPALLDRLIATCLRARPAPGERRPAIVGELAVRVAAHDMRLRAAAGQLDLQATPESITSMRLAWLSDRRVFAAALPRAAVTVN